MIHLQGRVNYIPWSSGILPDSCFTLEALGATQLWDEAWAAIELHLPKNQPSARRVDDRRVISGIVHMLKVGCRWCDCPADYGPSTTIYNRFNHW